MLTGLSMLAHTMDKASELIGVEGIRGAVLMQRKVMLLLTCLVALSGAVAIASPPTFEGFPVVNVTVNGTPIKSDVPAVLFNGRTMLPLRAVGEAMGAAVSWDQATYTAILSVDASEQIARLAADNRKLTDEVARLRSESDSFAAELTCTQDQLQLLQKPKDSVPAVDIAPTASPEIAKLVADVQALGYDVQYAEQDEGQHYSLPSSWNYVQVGIQSDAIPNTGNYDIGAASPVLQQLIPIMQKYYPQSEIWVVFIFNKAGGRYSRCERSTPSIRIGGCLGAETGGIYLGGAQNRWVKP